MTRRLQARKPEFLDAGVCSAARGRERHVSLSARSWLAVPALLSVLFLVTCTEDAPAPLVLDTTSETSIVLDVIESLWSTQSLAASTSPSVVITDPIDQQYISAGAVVTPVAVTVSVLNWAFPDDSHRVRLYLDQELKAELTTSTVAVLEDVPIGIHILAAVLVVKEGTAWVELTAAAARDVIDIRVKQACAAWGDPICDDGSPCSVEQCVSIGGGNFECHYGYLYGCCMSDYQCDPGWRCIDSECSQCETVDECDDDNICTVDSCSGGLCINSHLPECCVTDGDCDDGLFCTVNLCNVLTNVCGYVDNGDPKCCEFEPDAACDDANPCTLDRCLSHVCRHGPVTDEECCGSDDDCDDGNPCTIDSCDGSIDRCEHVLDDTMVGCCNYHSECDDSDPSTLDWCQQHLCTHTDDPLYCDATGENPCLPDANLCTVDACVNNVCTHTPSAGCCVVNKDCNDGDACTTDLCGLGAGPTGTCSAVPVAGCCNFDAQCDDGDPCNLDRCINHICRHGPDSSLTNCCQTSDDCEDGCACTDDVCLGDHSCYHILLNDDCCFSALDCDDGDDLTVDTCKDCACQHADDPQICDAEHQGCSDNNPCTMDTCSLISGHCLHQLIPGCCLQASDCDDGQFCTQDACNLTTHTCTNVSVAGCCVSDDNCNDGNACTQDLCVSKQCRHLELAQCCSSDLDCDTGNDCYVGTCHVATKTCSYSVATDPDLDCCSSSQDCYDGLTCTTDVCVDFHCGHSAINNCCTVANQASVCNDSNPCTYDACVFGICRNLPPYQAPPEANIPLTCCSSDAECESDNNPCTMEKCIDGLCETLSLVPCYLSLPYVQLFSACNTLTDIGWSVVDDGVDASDNWTCSSLGGLGPDKHARFGWQPWKVGVDSFAVSPWLSLSGQTRASVQWDRDIDHFSDEFDVALVISESVDFSENTDLWSAMVTSDITATTATLQIPTSYMGKGIRLGVNVRADTTYDLDAVDFDSFRVCPGRMPIFTTIPAPQSLLWNQSRILTLKAADPDANSHLTFTLEGAPDFVTLGNPFVSAVIDYVSVEMKILPDSAEDVGEYEVTVVVSDGCLLDRIKVVIRVFETGGYLLFAPPEVPPVHAQRLVQAVESTGRRIEVVDDLADMPSFAHLDGILVTLGVYGATHLLTSAEAYRLATYLGSGGHIYFEGGRTWVSQPDTVLHPFFHVYGTGTGPQTLTGSMVGVHFNYGLSFGLSAAYDVNSFLDRIQPAPGALVIGRVSGATPIDAVIAWEDATMGYRSVATNVPFAALQTGTSSTITWMERILDYLEHGLPDCAGDDWCYDSNPCTLDECALGFVCQHSPIEDCTSCADDGDCAGNEACIVDTGLCEQIPGERFAASGLPLAIDTLPGNATVVSAFTLVGAGSVAQVHAKVALSHAYSGELRLTLSHAGQTVTLKTPDATRATAAIRETYIFGADITGPGSMSDFVDSDLAGEWTLTVVDTTPGSASGLLEEFAIFVVTDPCLSSADCVDGNQCTDNVCYHTWCLTSETDCTDMVDGLPNLCTTDACDPAEGCQHVLKNCDDSNPCTADACLPETGLCVYEPADHCTGTCSTHADCGWYDYCDLVEGLCKPVPGHVFEPGQELPADIPDGSLDALQVEFDVGTAGRVRDAYLKVVATHSYRGDLSVVLTNGTASVTAHNRTGGAADNLYRVYDFDLPDGPGTLSGFDGLQSLGTWRLTVMDHSPGDRGQLVRSILFLTIEECRHDLDCDDEDICTVDRCVLSGGVRVCERTQFQCSDELFCNGEETCDPVEGCLEGTPPGIDDGVDCTADFCDEEADVVSHVPSDGFCNDDLWCNGQETCDPILDCVVGPAPELDDGVSCTQDLCDESIDQLIHLPQDALCDDTLWCNGEETCDPSLDCQPGEPPTANDGIGCTQEVCHEDLDVILHEASDALCDDGQYCNGLELCHPTKGCLAGIPWSLSDGVACTLDACNESLDQVEHTPVLERCDDGNPCTDDDCDALLGCINSNNTDPCDDGSICTTGDSCVDGQCVPGGVAPGCTCFVDGDCPDDGNVCNGEFVCIGGVCVVDPATVIHCGEDPSGCKTYVCNPVSGACSVSQAPFGTPCEGDGNLCTVNGRCAGGVCEEFAADCDDGIWCNGSELCLPATGCVSGAAPALDDGVACTADFCDEATGTILHEPIASFCSDELFCNGQEICDPLVGCKAGVPPVLTDGVPCTLDVCNEALNSVEHTPRDYLCDDGVYCNGAEQCDVVADCVPGSIDFLDDGNPCTLDGCDELLRVPLHVPDDSLCDDGNDCNGLEFCHTGFGCRPGSVPAISDGILCTVDTCDPATGVVTHVPNHAICSDGVFCNGIEECSVSLGCQPGAQLPLVDPWLCTVDSCDEQADLLIHQPDHSVCDDGNVCTDDICDPEVGCTHVNNTRWCDNGNACTMNDQCGGGTCNAGDPNPECWCAVDFDCPQDGNLCNGMLICESFQCVIDPISVVLCDDSGDTSCSRNTCNPATGLCAMELQPVGALCDDGDLCTIETRCDASGACNSLEDLDCDNGQFCDGEETCDSTLGCLPGTPPAGSDGIDCTVDLCNESTDTFVHVRTDSLCDDGLYCNGAERCNSFIGCVAGSMPDPDDGIGCTVDNCDEAGDTIRHTPDHAFCSDFDPCNGEESCDVDLDCIPGFLPGLDDGVACTLDACNPVTGQVTHTPQHNLCSDGLYCNGVEVCDAVDGCQEGVPPDSDDGIGCTLDACDEGTDRIIHLADSSLCDDGVFCDGIEVCDLALGCVSTAVTGLDDGVACTADSCDEASRSVNHVLNHSACDDGLFCNGAERCDAVAGCQPGPTPSLSDGIVCTQDSCDEVTDSILHVPQNAECKDGNLCTTDLCVADFGCAWVNNTDACDDAEPCTTADACSGGVCVGGPPSGDPSCECSVDSDCPDDGNLCNGDLVCQSGHCVVKAETPVVCPDSGDPCIRNLCQPATGACVFTPAPTGFPCQDGNPCTTDDRCLVTGICGGGAAACGDGLFCNGSEGCDPVTGDCLPGTAPALGDGNPCTVDYCDEATDTIKHVPEDALCDDGNFCNGVETCNPVTGCHSGTPVPISDGIPCTQDSCDESLDSVVHIPQDSVCDDGLFCNGKEVCSASLGCQPGSSPAVDDGLDCTLDSCDEVSDKVLHEPDHDACLDSDPCNGIEFCQPGVGCQPGLPPAVDDGIACTVDGCDPLSGVFHLPDDSACNDGLFCNGAESCRPELGCRSGTPPVLTDDVACTLDYCDELLNVVAHMEDDAFCDDGQFCNGAELCDAVEGCKAGSNPVCTDGNPCSTDQCNPTLDGGSGACDFTGRVQHCTASCGGAHSYDAGDNDCGYDDACVGGLAGSSSGTCSPLCLHPDCVSASGAPAVAIPDGGCIHQSIFVSTPQAFVGTVDLRLLVNHYNIGDLEVTLMDPDGTSVKVWNHAGNGRLDFYNTFARSYPTPYQSLCVMQGDQPSGEWVLSVCDTRLGNIGQVESFALYVTGSDQGPMGGDTCGDAIPISELPHTETLTGETICATDASTGSCGGMGARDRVYRLDLTQPRYLQATLSTAGWDGVLYLKPASGATCSDETLLCTDACDPGQCDEQLARLLTQPGTYYLFVDGMGGGSGYYDLDIVVAELLPDGNPCVANHDCLSNHCSGGICCAEGDCCLLPIHCPTSYEVASTCLNAAQCQGIRMDRRCVDFQCDSLSVDDDSGCENELANACGAYKDLLCSADLDQEVPSCPTHCTLDSQCDTNAHCDETCILDVPNGSSCDEDTDCISNHCSNGVCCLAGDCCVTAGDCPYEYVVEPVCDVQGSCQGHRADVMCWNYICGQSQASDDTACGPTMVANECGLYLPIYCTGEMEQTAPVCPTSCTLDEQCDAEAHCDAVCLLDVEDGAFCDEDSDCVSAHCQNGFCCAYGDCCDVAGSCPGSYVLAPQCDVPAQCQGHREDAVCLNHVCGAVSVEDDSGCVDTVLAQDCDLFRDLFCSGLVTQTPPVCLASCANDAQCDAVAHCDEPDCLLDLADGQACDEASDCVSAHCQNGFCCAGGDCCSVASDCPSDYTGAATCDLPANCQGHKPTATCTSSTCFSASVENDSACDASVVANACGYYVDAVCSGGVVQSTPMCLTACTLHSDCDPTAHCDGNVCQPRLGLGALCDEAEDCLSGFCADNTCCNNACAGDCRACDVAGMEGTCTDHTYYTDPEGDCGLCEACDGGGVCAFVFAGDDPTNDCPTFSSLTCKGDGSCDGAGACRKWVAGTVCADPTCVDGELYTSGTCDGLGTCVPGAPASCSPYQCNDAGDACRDSCDDNGHCALGYVCNAAHNCVLKKDKGDVCENDGQCVSGFCRDGYCCDSDCSSICQSCNQAGDQGTCLNLPNNTDPDNDCPSCEVCNGTGACRPVTNGSDPMHDCTATVSTTCGLDGFCNGSSQCRFWVSGTLCGDQSCDAGIQTNLDSCDGTGVCLDGGTTPCHPYTCQGTSGCYDACSSDAECADDAWCNSGTCEAGRPAGMTCSANSQCALGFCVDGYCCGSACNGTCQSCATNPGVCTPYAADTDPQFECGLCRACNGASACAFTSTGLDPKGECASTPEAGCGLDGGCNGAGACRLWSAGTLCEAQTCVAGVLHLADLCDGSGTCADSGTDSCDPYLCNELGTSCKTFCDEDAHCISTHYCLGNACVPKMAQGSACSQDRTCASGHCVDGYCCENACDGLCKACDLTPGACLDLPSGTDPEGECASCQACGGDGSCQAVVPGLDPKDDCTDEGVSTCGLDGTCDGSGLCRQYVSGSVCQQAGCAAAVLELEHTCDGSGACLNNGTWNCSPYQCNDLGTDCRTTCSDNSHCLTTHFCSTGSCVPNKANGSLCVSGFECESSFCVDGRCCGSSCSGACQSCALPGKLGTCSLYANNTDPEVECGLCRVCNGGGACKDSTAGSDPKAECPEDAMESCGSAGVCDGAGACAFWPLGIECGDPGCTGHVREAEGYCDGAGSCVPGVVEDCTPYVCSANGLSCRTVCVTNVDCVTGYYCGSDHHCLPDKALGDTCMLDSECASTYCVDGYCCDSACDGLCESCSILGTEGTCTLREAGLDPEVECPVCMVCDGTGACDYAPLGDDPKDDCGLDAPESCLGTGTCDGLGNCAVWPSGTPCGDESCSAALYSPPDLCDGWGSCVNSAPESCSPYPCAPTGDVCLTGCTGDSECLTGFYCLGNACVPRKANGETCTQTRECLSNRCVDGYCCDSACDGICMSCSENPGTCTLRSQGSDPENNCGNCMVCDGSGGCEPAAPGSDPKGQCPLQSASTCGLDGTCDGSGDCRLWNSGTVCQNSYCATAVFYHQDLCNGAGLCVDGGTVNCDPYRCNAGGDVCLTSCASDGDCASAYWCDTDHVCKAKRVPGSSCGASNQCQTGFCADGVCCDSACDGDCRACDVSGMVGVCVFFDNNSDPETECGHCQACNGAGSCKMISDGLDPLNHCTGTASTSCGLDGACDGAGLCRYWADTTICVSRTCVDHVKYLTYYCSGAGNCVDSGFVDCSPYRCITGGDDCRVNCVEDTHCMSDFYCSGSTCTLKKGRGATCLEERECRSGFCTDGYCCDEACGGICETCAMAGNVGTCMPQPATTDPELDCPPCEVCDGSGACTSEGDGLDVKNECASTDPSVCGQDGLCDGAGACRYWDSATVCKSVKCVDYILYLTDFCSGSGACVDSGMQSCSPYRCAPSGVECRDTCSSDDHCFNGNYCDVASCVPKKTNGATCLAGRECVSGKCVDGYCCNSDCAGLCESCALTAGTCTLVASGQDPYGECGLCQTCDGVGGCSVVAAGADPLDQCALTPPGGCGPDGTCDGAGACRSWIAGTECREQTCIAGTRYLTDYCDGAGECVDTGLVTCAPYFCDGDGVHCATSCSDDSDCIVSHYCSGNACIPKEPLGTACGGDANCASGHCVEGLCCQDTCLGECRSCAVLGSEGICTFFGNNADPEEECGSCRTCNGAGSCKNQAEGLDLKNSCTAKAPSTCGLDGVCNGLGACRQWPGGTLCQSASCSVSTRTGPGYCDGSGSCLLSPQDCESLGWPDLFGSNLVCGETDPCSGAVTFDVAEATCQSRGGRLCTWSELINNETRGTGCGYDAERVWTLTECGENAFYTGPGDATRIGAIPQQCTAFDQTAMVRCCGDRSSCDPYLCQGTGCASTCTDDASCVDGYYCSSSTCLLKKSNGGVCTSDGQCASGHCVDGYCCDDGCVGPCRSCAIAGLEGTCSGHPDGGDPEWDCDSCKVCDGVGGCRFAADGTDPKTECAQSLEETCGTDGVCDGAGDCRLWAAGTLCETATCAGTDFFAADLCDGSGTCADSGSSSCCPYRCNGASTACLTGCTLDSQCCTGNYCNSGSCVPLRAQGATCTAGRECSTGICVDGYCCDGACDGACESCSATPGTCTPRTYGTDPEGDCASCQVCSGSASTCVDVPAGQDPANDCPALSASTCDLDGTCDGSGGCRQWVSGTQCNAQLCVGDTLYLADSCNGSGTCVDSGTAPCSPYQCNDSSTACRTTCAADEQCSSGFYCDGTHCVVLKANGAACGDGHECTSHFCADGVCCTTSCSGECLSCVLSGSIGTCTAYANNSDPELECPSCEICNGAGACKFVTTGTDPKGNCAFQDPSTCDNDGQCDGAGSCRLWAAGTVCVSESCVAGVYRPEDTCNGAGDCVDAGSSSCAPYVCSGTICLSTCSVDANCAAGYFCQGSSCVPQKANGEPCSAGSECGSTFCVDGYCCNGSCSGSCRACNLAGLEGSCTYMSANTDPANECGSCRICNGSGSCANASDGTDPKENCAASSSTTCGLDGMCNGVGACRNWWSGTPCTNQSCSDSSVTATRFCDGSGTCVPEPLGCTTLGWSTAPQSPFVCAQSTPCSGLVNYSAAVAHCESMGARLCTWDELEDGETVGSGCSYENRRVWTQSQCSNTGHLTGPGDPIFIAGVPKQCRSNTLTAYVRCCATQDNCCPYKCDGNGCATTCSGDAGCCSGYYCSAGVCVAKASNGDACSVDDHCASGQCVDGVCCDTGCTSTCMACDIAGHRGTCYPVASGTDADHECGLCEACNGAGACANAAAGSDPHNECTALAGATCATTGTCDGSGDCALWPLGTVCGPSHCTSGVYYVEDECDGLGACIQGLGTTCSPYVCNGTGTACLTSCTLDSQCAAGFICSGGSCVALKINGETCGAAKECISGFCSDGVCCNVACGGLCQACDVSPYLGTCTNYGNATDPDSECGFCETCNGAGLCTAVAEGLDPLDDCASSLPSSCGNDGTCNGAGSCRKWPGGTVCSMQACSGSTLSMERYCDGDGTCVTPSAACDDLGWPWSYGSAYICGESDLPSCSGLRTYDQAKAFCAAAGGRLCSWGELANNETQGTGCGYDAQRVWTLSECGEDSYYTGAGSSSYLGTIPQECSARTTLAYVRCCATDNNCSPYTCYGNSCRTSCTLNTQCLSGYYCGSNQCLPKKSNGDVCGSATECSSGQCVDGYCCNSSCTGSCRACNVAGSEGTCSYHAANTDPENNCSLCKVCSGVGTCVNVTAGQDPTNDCSQDPTSTCGQDGTCSGSGYCRFWDSSTACVAASCSGNVVYKTDYCNGMGTCLDSGSTNCCPYVCSGGACLTSCGSSSDCCAGSFCLFGNCW